MSDARGIEVQVEGKLRRPLAPRRKPGKERIEELFQDEQQPGEVVIGEPEIDLGCQSLDRRHGVQRSPGRAGGQIVDLGGRPVESLAKPACGQREEVAQRRHAELCQVVALLRREAQPVEGRGAGSMSLLGGAFEHERIGVLGGAGAGGGVGAVAGEADDDPGGKSDPAKAIANRPPPAGGGPEHSVESGAVEPEHPRLLGAGLDVRGEVSQAFGDLPDGAGDLVRPDGAGTQLPRERERRGVAHPRQDPEPPGALADPEEASLGALLGHHGHRTVHPLGVPPAQELKRQRRDVNAGQPAHGAPPCVSSRDLSACL